MKIADQVGYIRLDRDGSEQKDFEHFGFIKITMLHLSL
jgi:hypothetical protein